MVEAECRCGGRLYERIVGQDTSKEWAHFDAFDESDRTRCPDGETAAPA